jgi:hypothetical protein
MSYKIKTYSFSQAKKLGVTIKPSVVSGKKIDVYNKKGEKIASIGAIGYGDYPTFMSEEGKEYAERRRKAYKQRHEKDRHVVGSAGYYADKILWILLILANV